MIKVVCFLIISFIIFLFALTYDTAVDWKTNLYTFPQKAQQNLERADFIQEGQDFLRRLLDTIESKIPKPEQEEELIAPTIKRSAEVIKSAIHRKPKQTPESVTQEEARVTIQEDIPPTAKTTTADSAIQYIKLDLHTGFAVAGKLVRDSEQQTVIDMEGLEVTFSAAEIKAKTYLSNEEFITSTHAATGITADSK